MLGKRFSVRRHFAVEVGTADTQLAVCTDKTVIPATQDFLRAFLAEGFSEGSEEVIITLVDVGVAVRLGHEDIGVRGAVERLLDQGAVAVIAAVGVSDFLTDGLGFEGLSGLTLVR